jgi:hypothetical protein
MASIRVVLQYDGHEAHTDIPLRTDLRETLRRVGLKRGGSPHDETAFQVAADIRRDIEDHQRVQKMLRELVEAIDQ